MLVFSSGTIVQAQGFTNALNSLPKQINLQNPQVVPSNPLSQGQWKEIRKMRWSGVLPNKYANCLLQLENGKPKIDAAGRNRCQSDGHDHFLSASRNGADVYVEDVTIEKSEATEACKAIGGFLPTKEEIQKLGTDVNKLGISGLWLWTSSHNLIDPHDAWGYTDDGYSGQSNWRGSLQSVVCIKR